MRTPEARFAGLPGFPFRPRYLEWRGMRAHYVDEGSGEKTLLCLHGQPTWSYLYRRMIPPFVASGARVVAPDFIGFGRSDKPEDEAEYSFDSHRTFLLEFIESKNLGQITLVVQDWGGLLGLTLPMEMPERFERLLVMNTALGTGDVPLTEGFIAWRAYSSRNPDLACGRLLARACPHLTPAEAAAYDAPFPDARYKAGVRAFPKLVPEHENDPGAAISRKARDWLKNEWQGETLMAIGAKDPVLGLPAMQLLRSWIRNCPEPLVLEDGGHFLQEWGDEVAQWFLSKT
ncbi:MAG TPA: haloalkane dehalogenase [Burkholderiales bacterium]|nr:haloalkane dehalogenase [Burkholderiales bacterium]